MSEFDNNVEPEAVQGNTPPENATEPQDETPANEAANLQDPNPVLRNQAGDVITGADEVPGPAPQTNEPEQIPQVGDQVQLKSGGPVMTVEKYSMDGRALCRWNHGTDEAPQSTAAYFHYSTLQKVTS